MAKKYLTIEEAAELLGVEPSDLSRLREKGEIRAFADRGNWKFRQDDVDELARKRQTDSDPDVPIFRSPPSSKPTKKDEFSDSFSLDIPGSGKDDSSINLGNEPDEVIGNQPTIVRKGGLDDLMGSDSDVRLVFDDSLMPDNSEDVLSDSEHSDSDVRLINFGDSSDEGSDSDVKLVPDKASVKTPHNQGQGSDSDVTLIGSKDDSFTLDLDQSDGSFVFGGESSGIALGGFSDDEEEEGDSGITLELAGDSGIALDIGDSGISLDPGGSGISLESDDSSLLLAGDSGISLGGPSDSGIALEGLAGDSGVKNKDKGKSKSKRQANNDLGGTMPEIPLMSLPEDDLQSTQMEVPLLGGQDSEFEFTASPLDDDSNANVPMLRDSGDSSAKKGGAKNANKKKGKKQDEDDDLFDTSAAVEFDAADDDFDSNADVFADDSDDMEVADDVIGEDDEIAEDVFGAADEDFDEELQSGQSASDFAVPSMGSSRAPAMPIQAEWGGATFGMLLVSSAIMLLTSFMMYDVVRTMWGNNEPNSGTEMILSSFRGMFS